MNLKINSDKNSATGNYGRNHIWLTLNENEIRISMTPGGKNYTDVPDSTLIIEELIGNQTSAETFEGKINNKYGIVMQLLILGSDVSGTYHYTSRKSPITLSGTLDSDGSIRLEEKPAGKLPDSLPAHTPRRKSQAHGFLPMARPACLSLSSAAIIRIMKPNQII